MHFNISKGRAGESSSQDAVAEKMKREQEKIGQEEKRDLGIGDSRETHSILSQRQRGGRALLLSLCAFVSVVFSFPFNIFCNKSVAWCGRG